MEAPASERSSRLIQAWAKGIDRLRTVVLVGAIVLVALSCVLISGLPLHASFEKLLPPDAQSVKDLEHIKSRARSFGSLFVVVDSTKDTKENRAAATEMLKDQLGDLSTELVDRVQFDLSDSEQYIWDNRFLFAELTDLERARDALKEKIREAKLDANPLFVDLDDEDEEATAKKSDELEELRKRFDEAKAKLSGGAGILSNDAKMQALIIKAPFMASDNKRGGKLISALDDAIAASKAKYPNTDIGYTGDILGSKLEHKSILEGMISAAAITIALVWIGLILYYRSFLSVMCVLWALMVGSLVTFGLTKLLIGHLNIASAFLASIVIGNGINAGLIVLARFFEEKRGGTHGLDAVSNALVGAFPGTVAAYAAAAVAYGSLVFTDFRGFRHFGIIGGLGMILCWVSAYTVLPAALLWLESHGWIKVNDEPLVGRVLSKLFPDRKGIVLGSSLVILVAAVLVTAHYIKSDPLENDWRNLRSTSNEILQSKAWNDKIGDNFPQGFNKGASRSLVVALDSRDKARAAYKSISESEAGLPKDKRIFRKLRSFEDFVPRDQQAKITVLTDIRDLLDGKDFQALDQEERKTLADFRPPDQLKAIREADVPRQLADLFVEKDGSLGKIFVAIASERFSTWNVRDLVQLAGEVRALELPQDTVIGGQAFVFADMLSLMERDGPIATLISLLGSLLAVGFMIGFRGYGFITLACTLLGTLCMIAIIALIGIKVNFLDFIALPITVGIGIDYAVNIASRYRQDGHRGQQYVLSTTGGAVLLASYTTIIGYGSLILSDNAGIRSFGIASIVGEFTCLIAALALAPALLKHFTSSQS